MLASTMWRLDSGLSATPRRNQASSRMDRRQVPADNVWFPAEVVDENTAVRVIASYFQVHADNYEARALVVPCKDELTSAEENLALATSDILSNAC